MPPLLADFTHARPCKPFCEKYLTLPELLFKVISDRSEKSSTIVTTNLPFSKWAELFENTTMVAALIDRLTFRSHVLDMNGDSYRLKATMQNKA